MKAVNYQSQSTPEAKQKQYIVFEKNECLEKLSMINQHFSQFVYCELAIGVPKLFNSSDKIKKIPD